MIKKKLIKLSMTKNKILIGLSIISHSIPKYKAKILEEATEWSHEIGFNKNITKTEQLYNLLEFIETEIATILLNNKEK